MDDEILQDHLRGRRILKWGCLVILAAISAVASLIGDGVFTGYGKVGVANVTANSVRANRQAFGDMPQAGDPLEVEDRLVANPVRIYGAKKPIIRMSSDGPRKFSIRKDQQLPVAIARAASVVLSSGRQVGRGKHYDVRLSSMTREALKSVDVSVPSRTASASEREAALVLGLGRLTRELGSVEGAIACLRVERKSVETALDLALSTGARKPEQYESFSKYLSASEKQRSEGLTKRVMALAIGFNMHWPVPQVARVSSGFGLRVHPVLGQEAWHYGTDLAVEPGTPIRAMADGLVVFSREDAVNGKFVKLDHGYGLTSAYVHNSKLTVKEGRRVKKGQLIASSGATGRATGPHLHFQIELDNRPIDPESFRERRAPRAHRQSVEAEAIGEARLPHVHAH